MTTEPTTPETLLEAREGFHTRVEPAAAAEEAAPEPPQNLFEQVHFPAPVGDLAAYVLKVPPGTKHPAVLWLPGRFHAGLTAEIWEECSEPTVPAAQDFQAAGVVLMYPSFRGGNDNPGVSEGFFGEVEDVLAAAHYLQNRPEVDAERIYLAGHSTGGTLALLVAETGTKLFRGIVALGPRHEATAYAAEKLPFDVHDAAEARLRSPRHWLAAIQAPTLVLEGDHRSNFKSWQLLKQTPHPARLQFHLVAGADHFSLVRPVGKWLSATVAGDDADLGLAWAQSSPCLEGQS